MSSSEPRITALESPFDEDVADTLGRLMGTSKVAPLILFRTIARHVPLARAFADYGAYFLRGGALAPRDREIVIHRTTARLGAEYEWGVHAAIFAPRVGLSADELAATAVAGWDHPVWTGRDRVLVRLVDELNASASVSEQLWSQLREHWTEAEILELLLLCGSYRAVSYVVNALRVPLEDWAPRFPDRAA